MWGGMWGVGVGGKSCCLASIRASSVNRQRLRKRERRRFVLKCDHGALASPSPTSLDHVVPDFVWRLSWSTRGALTGILPDRDPPFPFIMGFCVVRHLCLCLCSSCSSCSVHPWIPPLLYKKGVWPIPFQFQQPSLPTQTNPLTTLILILNRYQVVPLVERLRLPLRSPGREPFPLPRADE